MKYTIEVTGKNKKWVVSLANKDQADAMREDGFSVQAVHYDMPSWVLDFGLAGLWCAATDAARWPLAVINRLRRK